MELGDLVTQLGKEVVTGAVLYVPIHAIASAYIHDLKDLGGVKQSFLEKVRSRRNQKNSAKITALSTAALMFHNHLLSGEYSKLYHYLLDKINY